jgi:hypothetical protein
MFLPTAHGRPACAVPPLPCSIVQHGTLCSMYNQSSCNSTCICNPPPPPPLLPASAVPEDSRTIWAANNTLRLHPLPVVLFPGGHVAFVQRLPWEQGVEPYVVHATFQRYNNAQHRQGKRGRFRCGGAAAALQVWPSIALFSPAQPSMLQHKTGKLVVPSGMLAPYG